MSESQRCELGGQCHKRFSGVEKQFLKNLTDASPLEVGAALAVFVDGELVVDLYGGQRDVLHGAPWQQQTPVCVFSCTKGVVSVLAMRLVQQGRLDYDAPVAQYWPEYACHGKESTSVAQLFSHQAGLPNLEGELASGDIWHWDSMCAALAASTPKWEPGKRHGYHALTWGYLVGAVLERAAGLPLETLLQQELCDVLRVNFNFGLPVDCAGAVAQLCSESQQSADAQALGRMRSLDESVLLTPAVANSQPWRNSLIPGANGHCTAVDLATIYQHLLPGNNYVDRELVEYASAVQVAGRDAVLGVESAYGLGFQIATRELSPGLANGLHCWGHRGIYGATGFVDETNGLAVAYVMNYCADPQGDQRSKRLLESIYASLPRVA